MIQLFNDRFENVLPNIKFDAIITDPPYPDYLTEEYGYYEGIIDWCKNYTCKQLIFWSARVELPLDYTAIHIWNKNPSNAGAQYERIFERNGGSHYKVYTHYMVNSTVAAQMTRDIFFNHPIQKPLILMRKLIDENTKKGDTIFDPFMGSGTTAVAAIKEGRNFIGCEKNTAYFNMAQERIKQFNKQLTMFPF